MDDLHLLLKGGRLSPPQTPPLLPLLAGVAQRREELLLDEARALLAEGAALVVAAPGAGAGADSERLAQALELFDAALAMTPSLKSHAWERGWALYHLNRLPEAREQFEASCGVDDDDLEPWLWRFLCDARIHGSVKAAQAGLQGFRGWDKRLCMMQVLDLFKGEGSVEEVLEGACGDRHSAARASFASALYFEAKGESCLAHPLLSAVAGLDGDGDLYLYSLARSHLARLHRRVAATQGLRVLQHKGPLSPEALSPRRLLNTPFAAAAAARVGVVAALSSSC